MPTYEPPRAVTTPMEVLKLFLRGVDTVDIAAHYGIREHEAYRLLRFAIEARRMGHDTGRDTIPAEHEPPLEGH
jgi:hypothetical protein